MTSGVTNWTTPDGSAVDDVFDAGPCAKPWRVTVPRSVEMEATPIVHGAPSSVNLSPAPILKVFTVYVGPPIPMPRVPPCVRGIGKNKPQPGNRMHSYIPPWTGSTLAVRGPPPEIGLKVPAPSEALIRREMTVGIVTMLTVVVPVTVIAPGGEITRVVRCPPPPEPFTTEALLPTPDNWPNGPT